MQLLLDTCTVLWHFEDSGSLSRKAKAAIDNPENQVFISTASFWEMAVKISIEKLKIEYPLPDVYSDYKAAGVKMLSLAPEHALAVEGLALHHRDPFDRMLITQAMLEKLTLVTHDGIFDEYKIPLLW
jgi:PIN domain nuclease of toxin-antitoxin system